MSNEQTRLQALYDLDLLDTPESESFDRITRMASHLFRAPISAVSLTDRHRQWFKSHVGTQGREIPIDGAPCAEVTRSAGVLVIPNMLDHPAYSTSLLAQSGVRFYAGAPLITRDAQVLGAMCVLDSVPRDISPEEVRSLQDLAAMVMSQIELEHDLGRIEPSSGLPNRHQCVDDLEDQTRVHKGESRVAILIDLVDARQFRETVSVLGNSYIDSIVKSSSQTLRAALGSKTGLYHWSLVSFVLILPNEGEKSWRQFIDLLRERLRSPVMCNDIPVSTDVVFGVTAFALGEALPREILRSALSAAQDARKAEVDLAVYSISNDEENQRRFAVLTNARKAVGNLAEFHLVYQPRVDLRTGICLGAEALLRWHNPQLGNVSPGEFIPLIEQTVMARPVTQMVLAMALEQMSRWLRAGLDIRISINISARNLEEEDFAASVVDALQRFGVPPTAIELEFTESAFIRHRARVLDQLDRIRAAGIELAIDDFGTGFSTFSYLHKLPATTLKLDQSFMRDLDKNAKDRVLVQSIISIAHGIGYRVVAEGVETADVYRFLKDCECDEVQGYFIARPLSVEAFETFVTQFRDRQSQSALALLGQALPTR